MATCPRCGAPLRPVASSCHVCGLAVGAAPAAAAPSRSGRGHRRLWWIVGGCALASAAVFAVWSFALRGPASSGDEFLGTWRSESMQSIGSATVTRAGDAFEVLLTAAQTGEQARVAAHVEGDRLVITPGDFSASGDPNAARLALALKLMAGDFRIELSSRAPSCVLLRLTGTSPAGQRVDERTVLEQAAASTAPS